jgi:hypothetical protein
MRATSLRILKVISAALLWILSGAGQGAMSAETVSACVGCHRQEATTQPETPMGRALFFPPSNATLKANPNLTIQKGLYQYTVDTHGENSVYSVTDGTRTISLPIRWNFGAGVQAWIFEREGRYYESLVSFYPETSALDTTIGDESLTPHNLDEAVGRELNSRDLKECFGCHATNSIKQDKLDLASFKPGVTCEQCHAGAIVHTWDAFNGDFSSRPPDLGKLSSEELSSFCGQCHRTWETVVRNHWRGPINVRFAPYRLANSKCFNGADSRIGCVACHNPHQNVVRNAAWYDSKCLACHASSAHTVSATSEAQAPACPVATSNCVSCHMPKVKLPDEHVTFTDHQIRVVKTGEPYPD